MKSSIKTIRDHKERMYKVLLYIQNNLDKPLYVQELAEIACFSPYHFHRLFTAYQGETFNSFLRRIRLERAASFLCHSIFSKKSITSIALDVGYQTPASFTRAFKRYFGKTPSRFKADKDMMSHQYNSYKGNIANRKVAPSFIRVFPEQKAAFIRITGKYDRTLKSAWNELRVFAARKGINYDDATLFGIPHDCSSIAEADSQRYDFCLMLEQDIRPEGDVGIQTIPRGRYIFFTHQGSYKDISNTYKSIFLNWFSKSAETLRNAPCIEIFPNFSALNPMPDDIEICIPIE